MKLTVYKNDEFVTVGIEVTESVYTSTGKHETHYFSHGVTGGLCWSKEVTLTPLLLTRVKTIISLKKEISDLENFRWTIFEVLKDNGWENGKGVKMQAIDKKIEQAQESLQRNLEAIS